MDLNLNGPAGHFHLAARAIILREGRILMVKARQGDGFYRHYYTVGGRVRFGETAAQAVEREVLEETGVAFQPERLLFIHEEFFERFHALGLIYLMKPNDAPVRSQTDDGESLEWLPIDQLGEYKVYPQFFPAELPRLTNEIKHFVTRE